MKKLPIVLLAISLAGCASMPVNQPAPAPVHKLHKAAKAPPAPVIVPPPAAQPQAKPLTFKQRFRTTFGRIKWLHK